MEVESPAQHLHVAIIGAGIGGLALATGLRRQNVPYTVYEAAAAFSAVGAGVAFGPNALGAMGRIDPRLRELYGEIATGNESWEKRHVFYDMLMSEEGLGARQGWMGESVAYSCFVKSSVHRRDLLDVMKSLVPEETVQFNKKAVGVVQEGKKVKIAFADGTSVEADVVVGCDGGKGITREAVLGVQYPDQVLAAYSGRYVYRAVVPMEDARAILGDYAGDGKMFMGLGNYFVSYQMSHGTQLNFLAARQSDKPWPNRHQWTQEVTKDEMLADFEGCDSRLMKLLDWAKPLRWSLHHHLSTPTYYNNRICILGDAAHVSTPHQGAGAGLCFEDALVLSRLLRLVTRSEDIGPALAAYDATCRPRAQEIVRTSDEAGRMYCFTDPECGSDPRSIVRNASTRFTWIWLHDLDASVEKAESAFRAAAVATASSLKNSGGAAEDPDLV